MKGRIVVRIVCVFALVSVLVAGILPSAALAKDDKPVVPPPNPVVYGELAAQWSQWAYAQPASANPMIDNSGEYCAVGQSGPVWFLAGTMIDPAPITRNCTVPAGKKLFFPVFNVTFIGYRTDTEDDARNVTHWVTDYYLDVNQGSSAVLSAEIDGVNVTDDELRANYRVSSLDSTTPIVAITVPEDNVVVFSDPNFVYDETCWPGGVCYPSTADGIYMLIHPLTPGQHTIKFSASGYLDVTYNLTVVPPGQATSGVGNAAADAQPMLYLPLVQE